MCASEGDLCYPLHNAARPMTDPKNTENQELSLDQLQDAAGGISADARGKTTVTSAAFNVMGSGVPVENIKEPQDKINNASDDAGGVVESLRSDNRF